MFPQESMPSDAFRPRVGPLGRGPGGYLQGEEPHGGVEGVVQAQPVVHVREEPIVHPRHRHIHCARSSGGRLAASSGSGPTGTAWQWSGSVAGCKGAPPPLAPRVAPGTGTWSSRTGHTRGGRGAAAAPAPAAAARI